MAAYTRSLTVPGSRIGESEEAVAEDRRLEKQGVDEVIGQG